MGEPRFAYYAEWEFADKDAFKAATRTPEFMETGKPIFAADLPYAREALDGYPMAQLLSLKDIAGSARKIRAFISGKFEPEPIRIKIEQPFCPDWYSFASYLKDFVDRDAD